jgi:phosphatidylinositol alpha-1,6-mannosyltransferase
VDERIFHPASGAGTGPDVSDELRRSLGLSNRRVIVSVSRLVAKNGLDRLVEAMPVLLRTVPEAALVLVGDGSKRQELSHLARRLGVEKDVHFVGEVAHEQTARYLRFADVFCRPSRSEGLGSAFLEAMATGVPVVATPVGGIPDFLRHGQNGLLVERPTPERLAATLEELMVDPDLARRVSRAGLELVRDRYRWDRIADEIGELYDELLA